MSTQKAVTANTQKNNGGTVLKGGNATTTAGSPVTNVHTVRSNATFDGYGAKVVLSSGSTGSSGNLGTYNAKTTFANPITAGSYIMRKVTTSINGSANTQLRSCASDVGARRYPSPINHHIALGSGVNNSWDYETGTITKGESAGNSYSYVDPASGGTANDIAAHGTNAVPGELTYRDGSATVVNDEYKPRTG